MNTNKLLIIIGLTGMAVSLIAGIIIFIREDMLHHLSSYFKGKTAVKSGKELKVRSYKTSSSSQGLSSGDSTELLESDGTELLSEDTELLDAGGKSINA